LLWAAAAGAAQDPPPAISSSPATESIDRRPYRISLHLGIDPSARIDEGKRGELVREWQVLVRRFIGPPWVVSVAESSSPLLKHDIESVEPEAFAAMTAFDKVWLVRVARRGVASELTFAGREYDVAARRLGPLQFRVVPAVADAPRAMLIFTRDLFNPTAEISNHEGGRALLTVQGSMIAPASPVGAVVAKGAVFQPLRLVSLRDGKVQVLRIPLTYLQVEAVEGPTARCTISSAFLDPLTKRYARPNSLVALGLKPGNSELRLRFVNKSDRAPAAGYTLTARLVPDGQPRELGTTDRAGRIVLKPGFASGLVILRLLAGNVEPIAELPIMPGESSEERVIAVDPKPETVALEAQLDSMRDEVVDLVALRARLEARMKARLEGEDWAGLEQALKEFAKLTPRDQFAKRLTELKEDAAYRQAELKRAILTKTAQAQISDLQNMIDRYLEDDAFTAYGEALDKGRAEVAAKAKAQAKKKTAAAPALVRPSEAAKALDVPPKAEAKPVPVRPVPKPAPPSQSTPF
jgi:hypothetical protein